MADELKRCAILGTAPSWKQCPFDDKGLHIFGLNDAWVLGYPRADAWFDLHPLSSFVIYKRTHPPDPLTVPSGTYLRPEGHLEFLKTQAIPVFLQEKRPDWPTSQTFPRDQVLAFWSKFWPYRVTRKGVVAQGKDYEVSSPAWMLMWAVMQGYTEIHIYGIHLATEWEYLQQRPNFEFLIGVAAGLGVKIVLPEKVPICQASFRYGYETKTDALLEPAAKEIARLRLRRDALEKALTAVPWYRRSDVKDLQARIARVKLELADAKDDLTRAKVQVA